MAAWIRSTRKKRTQSAARARRRARLAIALWRCAWHRFKPPRGGRYRVKSRGAQRRVPFVSRFTIVLNIGYLEIKRDAAVTIRTSDLECNNNRFGQPTPSRSKVSEILIAETFVLKISNFQTLSASIVEGIWKLKYSSFEKLTYFYGTDNSVTHSISERTHFK